MGHARLSTSYALASAQRSCEGESRRRHHHIACPIAGNRQQSHEFGEQLFFRNMQKSDECWADGSPSDQRHLTVLSYKIKCGCVKETAPLPVTSRRRKRWVKVAMKLTSITTASSKTCCHILCDLAVGRPMPHQAPTLLLRLCARVASYLHSPGRVRVVRSRHGGARKLRVTSGPPRCGVSRADMTHLRVTGTCLAAERPGS
jgi:hypothetical protein